MIKPTAQPTSQPVLQPTPCVNNTNSNQDVKATPTGKVVSRLNLTSIVDESVNDSEKFTHEEWKGTEYIDTKGNEAYGPEVDAINVKAASITST